MIARWRHSRLMYCTRATSISRVHFLEAFCACRTSMQAHLGQDRECLSGMWGRGKVLSKYECSGVWARRSLVEVWRPTCTVLSSYQVEECGSRVTWSPLCELRQEHTHSELRFTSHTSERQWCLMSQEFNERLPVKHMAWCLAHSCTGQLLQVPTWFPSAWQPHSTIYLHSC